MGKSIRSARTDWDDADFGLDRKAQKAARKAARQERQARHVREVDDNPLTDDEMA